MGYREYFKRLEERFEQFLADYFDSSRSKRMRPLVVGRQNECVTLQLNG